MLHAAAMFDGECVFRDRAKLAAAWREAGLADDALRFVDQADDRARDLSAGYRLRHIRSAPRASTGFRMPAGEQPAVIVGNERRGIAHDMQRIASHAVQIPLASRTLNSLNVAAASAVALYYLTRGGGRAHPYRARIHSNGRPECS